MKKIGIVGGGQLGLMLAEAAQKLNLEPIVLDPTPDCPAGSAARQVVGDFRDHDAVIAFAKEADVLTFEIESANAEALEELAASGFPVHPTPATLFLIRDKLTQKEYFETRGIPVAPFMAVEGEAGVRVAGTEFGYPFVLKARSGGYDGRGNATVASEATIAAAFQKLAGQKLYAEKFMAFDKELAVVAVRNVEGEIRTYPVVETIHENHICNLVLAPAPISSMVHKKAEALAHKVLESFQGAGIFGIEMFLVGEEVVVNEVAPRVHNSGHFTIEACETSQFENHIRAVAGLPLGATDMIVQASVMINILGERTGPAQPEGIEAAESLGSVKVHMYGKHETRPARKMGHITVVGNALPEILEKAHEARRRVSI